MCALCSPISRKKTRVLRTRMRLKIQRFDPEAQMKPHRIALFIGRRGTGKSKLMEDIMYRIKDKVDFGLCMTPTEETAAMFRSHVPDAWVYDGFSTSKLEQMIAMQRVAVAKGKEKALFLITDDCGFDRSAFKGKGIRDLFMNGRHVRISYLNAMQYCMDVTPDLRTQIDYVFCLKESIISNKQKLWKSFFGMFERYDDFSRTMDRCTDHYSCLVLDQTSPTSRIEDCVFWYRADVNLPPFKLGKPVFHKLATKHAKSAAQRSREMEVHVAMPVDRRVTQVERTDARGKVLPEDRAPVIIE